MSKFYKCWEDSGLEFFFYFHCVIFVVLLMILFIQVYFLLDIGNPPHEMMNEQMTSDIAKYSRF